MPTAETVGAAFLHTPQFLQGCALSNREFEIMVELRLGGTIHQALPATCIYGAALDTPGDQLLKCKRGNEWDTGHTAINQVMAAIVRSAHMQEIQIWPVGHHSGSKVYFIETYATWAQLSRPFWAN